jgi:HEPN domain-containing protein
MKTYADHARGWLRKSESDIKSLRVLLESATSYDAACFHAQQAAEKALKSVLAHAKQPIVKTHDLKKLVHLIVVFHPTFVANTVELELLSTYAIDSRYALDFWPDREQAAEALAMAERVRRAVLDILPPDLHPPAEDEAS